MQKAPAMQGPFVRFQMAQADFLPLMPAQIRLLVR